MDASPLPLPMDLPTPSDAEMRIDYGDDEPSVDAVMGDDEVGETTLEEAVMGDVTVEDEPVAVGEEEAVSMEVVEEAGLASAAGAGEELPVESEGVGLPQAMSKQVVGMAGEEQSAAPAAAAAAIDQSAVVGLPSASADATPLAEPLVAAPPSLVPVSNDDATLTLGSIEDSTPTVAEETTEPQAGQPDVPDVEVVGHEQEEGAASVESREDVEEPVVAENDASVSAVQEDAPVAADLEADAVEPVESTEFVDGEEEVLIKILEESSEGCLSCGSASTSYRPRLEISLLRAAELPSLAFAVNDESASQTAPAILLTYQNSTYSVFTRHDDSDENEDALDRTLPVLFEQADKHELYFHQVEHFIEALRSLFPELVSRDEEVVLELLEIGLVLPEDNMYTRQVTLEDLNRVHVGCHLDENGPLHLHLSAQPRFLNGFNALARHVALQSNGLVSDDESETVEPEAEAEVEPTGVTEAQEAGDSDSFVDVEQPLEGEGEGVAGGEEEHFEDGEWHDEDVEYPEGEGDDERAHEQEDEGNSEDAEVDLEEALADMDSEDLNALIEGVQEDYVLAGGVVDESHEGGSPGEVEVERAGEGGAQQEGGPDEQQAGPMGDAHAVVVDGAAGDNVPVVVVLEEEAVSSTIEQAEEDPSTAPIDADAPSLPAPAAALEVPAAPIEISYDTPLGAGDEPPSVPLDSLDAVVDAAAKVGPSPLSASNEMVTHVEGPEEPLAATEPIEDTTDDVVIDYEDAEEVSTSAPPLLAGTDSPLSPKRRREDGENEVPELGDESAAGESKRPRLCDLESEPATA